MRPEATPANRLALTDGDLRWNRYLVNGRALQWTRRRRDAGRAASGSRLLGVGAGRPRRSRWRPASPASRRGPTAATVFVDADADAASAVELRRRAGVAARRGKPRPRRRAQAARRPALARRYLAVEGHRALAAIERPAAAAGAGADRPGRRAADRFAGRVARRWRGAGQPIADPPASFGAIRARTPAGVESTAGRARRRQRAPHAPPRPTTTLAELAEDETRRRRPRSICSRAPSAAAGASAGCSSGC